MVENIVAGSLRHRCLESQSIEHCNYQTLIIVSQLILLHYILLAYAILLLDYDFRSLVYLYQWEQQWIIDSLVTWWHFIQVTLAACQLKYPDESRNRLMTSAKSVLTKLFVMVFHLLLRVLRTSQWACTCDSSGATLGWHSSRTARNSRRYGSANTASTRFVLHSACHTSGKKQGGECKGERGTEDWGGMFEDGRREEGTGKEKGAKGSGSRNTKSRGMGGYRE